MKLDVSFKKTSRDVRLYSFVVNQEEKSEFVKKALEFYIKYLEKENENR